MNRTKTAVTSLLLAVAGGLSTPGFVLEASAQCEWSSMGNGVAGLVASVDALTVWGDNLIVAGRFNSAGPITSNIARWNGQSWAGLQNVNGRVLALTTFNGNLIAAGEFTSVTGTSNGQRIASWNGQTWSPLGVGIGYRKVNAVAVFDDGSGPALYAGGDFQIAGGAFIDNIAKWNGQTWSPLGSGVNNVVMAMTAYSGGGVNALYVGGHFANAGGVQGATFLARWNGQSWSTLPSQLGGSVNVLRVIGDDLYVGGYFLEAGGVPMHSIARFNGFTWSPLGGGIDGAVLAIAEYQGNIYAGGDFNSAGSVPGTADLAQWDGTTWSPVQTSANGINGDVYALAAFGGGVSTNPALYAGGVFTVVDGITANRVARWNCLVPTCYPNCDGSTTPPILNVDDFTCFVNEFAGAQSLTHAQQVTHFANCDGSTTPPVLNVEDFTCFINAFASGCP